MWRRWTRRRWAGRCSAQARGVDPHAGILFHARRGAKVERGEPLATVFATKRELLAEPVAILREAIAFSKTLPHAVPLVGRVFTKENAENSLQNAVR
ncbi:MAG: hypothetical protein ABSD61_12770 [Terracidiphilus sp.]